jgi:hypothetical protein
MPNSTSFAVVALKKITMKKLLFLVLLPLYVAANEPDSIPREDQLVWTGGHSFRVSLDSRFEPLSTYDDYLALFRRPERIYVQFLLIEFVGEDLRPLENTYGTVHEDYPIKRTYVKKPRFQYDRSDGVSGEPLVSQYKHNGQWREDFVLFHRINPSQVLMIEFSYPQDARREIRKEINTVLQSLIPIEVSHG